MATNSNLLFSPVLPLALLLNGQLYYLGTMDLLGVPPSTPFTGGFYAFLSLWAVLTLLNTGQWRYFRFRIVDALAGCFLALVVASLLIFHYPGSVKSLGFVLFFVAAPYTLARMLNPPQIMQLLRVSVIMGAIMLVWIVVWLIFAYGGTSYAGRPNLFGFNHTPLLAGLLLGATAVLLAAFLARLNQPKRLSWIHLFSLALILALLWVLEFVGARGGLILTLFTIAIVLLAAQWMPLRRRVAVAGVIGAFVAVSFTMLPSTQARFFSRLGAAVGIQSNFSKATRMAGLSWREFEARENRRLGHVSSICDRIDWMQYHGRSDEVRKLLYRSAVLMALRHPWGGVGAGGFGYELCGDGQYFPHSTFLQAFAELGLFGGLLLVGIATLFLYRVLRLVQSKDGRDAWPTIWMLLPLWAFYVMSDQLYGDYMMAFQFFLLTGAGISLCVGLERTGTKAAQDG